MSLLDQISKSSAGCGCCPTPPTFASTGAGPLIALAGNPNSGKTTLFNALTGLNYKVANYPGVTVEKKEGRLQLSEDIEATLMDLPGLYSLWGFSFDEQIARAALFGELEGGRAPDLIIAVVDASNIERNLYLASQLIDLGLPIVIALTLIDLACAKGISVKAELLARQLGVPVIGVVAPKNKGIALLRQEIERVLANSKQPSRAFAWLPSDSKLSVSADRVAELNCACNNGNSLVNRERLKALAQIALVEPCANQELESAIQREREDLTSGGIDPGTTEGSLRYSWLREVLSASCTNLPVPKRGIVQKIDQLLINRFWGLVIFIAIMALMFQAIFSWATWPMDMIDQGIQQLGVFINDHMSDGPLRSLLVDGIVAGAGSVLVFVPQLLILFLFIGVLEDSGYLSRAAFVTDRVMRKFGLQGRSFIPLLSSLACAVPGIMCARTIPSWKDRLTTILVAPLMSCSARLPVYSLFIAAFIPNSTVLGFFSLQGLVLLVLYLTGAASALLVALLLKRSILRGEVSHFVMELPPFRMPGIKTVLRGAWDRVKTFLKSTGAIILLCSMVLWFLASHPGPNIEESYAAKIGHSIEPVIKPLGYDWRIGVGLISSLAAREVLVSTLATVYNLTDPASDSTSLIGILKEKRRAGEFSLAAALSLLAFYVFACQCMSTLAVCHKETGAWYWSVFMFTYLTLLAYGAAYLTFHVAVALGAG